jgi:uncharacterized membrane protein YdjX (TVP38/TMEM64 family)
VAYLGLVALVIAINLLPAFGPPTWTVLVVAKLTWHLNPVALVLLGAVASSTGRYALGLCARRFTGRLPQRLRTNLEAARTLLQRRRAGGVAIVGLFVVSPLPSAQLFVAAGLMDLPLRKLTAVFFVGRLMSYAAYVGAATVAEHHMGTVVRSAFGSPWSIVLQLLFLVAVGGIPFINWSRLRPASDQGDSTVVG